MNSIQYCLAYDTFFAAKTIDSLETMSHDPNVSDPCLQKPKMVFYLISERQ